MRFIIRLIYRFLILKPTRPRSRQHGNVRALDYRTTHDSGTFGGDAFDGITNRYNEAKVAHIIDGDTVVVVRGWERYTVRLDSIDCPENGQHWGDTAKYGLIKLIGGKKVRLEEHGFDIYGRLLATIYVEHAHKAAWINVNERMVSLGHAWVMRGFFGHLPKDRQSKLNRLEWWAKSKKVGLWRTPNPVPPWRWRSGGPSRN